jgi:hypothetical protein
MKNLLQLTAIALLALSTSQASAGLTVFTNVASIWAGDVIQKPVKGIHGDEVQRIRDADIAVESVKGIHGDEDQPIRDVGVRETEECMQEMEANYYLLLDLGCTDDEAMMILLFDSVIDVKPPTGVYVENEFE